MTTNNPPTHVPEQNAGAPVASSKKRSFSHSQLEPINGDQLPACATSMETDEDGQREYDPASCTKRARQQSPLSGGLEAPEPSTNSELGAAELILGLSGHGSSASVREPQVQINTSSAKEDQDQEPSRNTSPRVSWGPRTVYEFDPNTEIPDSTAETSWDLDEGSSAAPQENFNPPSYQVPPQPSSSEENRMQPSKQPQRQHSRMSSPVQPELLSPTGHKGLSPSHQRTVETEASVGEEASNIVPSPLVEMPATFPLESSQTSSPPLALQHPAVTALLSAENQALTQMLIGHYITGGNMTCPVMEVITESLQNAHLEHDDDEVEEGEMV